MKHVSPTSAGKPKPSLPKFISSIAPPIIKEVLAEFRSHKTLRFFRKTFIGSFKNFSAVSQNFHDVVSYNSSESEKEEISNAQKFRLAAEDAKKGIPPKSTDRQMLLCSLVSTFPKSEVAILDVGGGVGHSLAHLIYSCPNKKINLIVYELTPIADIGRSTFSGIKEISFIDNLKNLQSKIDFAFFGSSLQYFEDYKSIFRQISLLSSEIIALSYTPVTSAPTFVTAQVNMKHRIIPAKVINYQELLDFMSQLGFNPIFQSVSLTNVNFQNFSNPQSSSWFSNLVFAKTNSSES